LDTRIRFEYRDNDLRSVNEAAPKTALLSSNPKKIFNQTDNVFLQRTRLYLGIKEVLDPFRFAVEIADSRRYAGTNYRPVPNGDEINALEPIRLYAELHFDDLLPADPHGNPRPVSLRYGIHNFEFLDRRIIANNQWRNTANTFQGFHAAIGQDSNDWALDLLAVEAGTAPCGGAPVADKSLARERLTHHAVNGGAIVREADQRAPRRHAGDKALGAVDRIEHPNEFGPRRHVVKFLADDAVAGKIARNQPAHSDLGGAVGLRHRIERAPVRFIDGVHRGTEERQDGLARHARQFLDESSQINWFHWGVSFRLETVIVALLWANALF
jgi:hypothetical protein